MTTADIRNREAFWDFARNALSNFGMPPSRGCRNDYNLAWSWMSRTSVPRITKRGIDRASRILHADHASVLRALCGIGSLNEAISAQNNAAIKHSADPILRVNGNGRDLSAFAILANSRIGLANLSTIRNRSLFSLWCSGESCPPITASAIERASGILRLPASDIENALCPGGANAVYSRRALLLRIQRRGDMNDDGTYNRVCRWCGRAFVSPYAHGHPTCSDCHYGNEKYHDRIDVESGRASERNRRQNARNSERDRNRRAATNTLRQLGWVNTALDRIERAIKQDLRNAYRRVYRAERRAIAVLIERDNTRRKTKRRRAHDPGANRGAERNWWIFDVYKEFGYACAYCGISREDSKAEGFDMQADHIVPLGHPKCAIGPSNCAPACIHCNSSKGNRDMVAWAKSKGYAPHPLAISKYHTLMDPPQLASIGMA